MYPVSRLNVLLFYIVYYIAKLFEESLIASNGHWRWENIELSPIIHARYRVCVHVRADCSLSSQLTIVTNKVHTGPYTPLTQFDTTTVKTSDEMASSPVLTVDRLALILIADIQYPHQHYPILGVRLD
jgi:hypothetical protein